VTISNVSLDGTIRDGLPLVMRGRVIEAVLAAQRIAGEPVTAQQARATHREPIMRSARSFSDAARAIARTGPDELGRVLRRVGRDRAGFVRWWVEVPHGNPA
jgi:hypothetical protein